jgi:hypothetical protein
MPSTDVRTMFAAVRHHDEALRVVAGRLGGACGHSEVSLTDAIGCARENRVHLLLAGAGGPPGSDAAIVREALREEYRHAAACDAVETAAMRSLLAAAADRGVQPLVFKGAALAHRLYERSWERPRADVDLFICEADSERMRQVLEDHGWEAVTAVDGTLVTRQFQYRRAVSSEFELQVDVHTRLFNPAAFAGALEWKVARERAVPLAALGPSARTLSDADALLVACLHRIAHHRDTPELIWLCDIDRLARRMDAAGWETFAASAARARTRTVCRDSLEAAARMLAAPVPAHVWHALKTTEEEPSAAFVTRAGGELGVQWLNFRHLPGWRARFSLLVQHLLPSPRYMRACYQVDRDWILPLCYAHRVCAGAPRWIRNVLVPRR